MAKQPDIIQNIPTGETYPRKVLNGLNQVYSAACLKLISAGEEREILKSADLLTYTPEYPFNKADFSIRQSTSEYDVRLPHVTAGLLIPSAQGGERYMTGVGAYDFKNIPLITQMIAKNDEKAQVAIRIVFGGTEEMQFRALSMLIPALQQVENIGKQPDKDVTSAKPPQIQVVFANNIAAFVNGKDLLKMREQARLFIDMAEAYTDIFFPQAREQLVFLEDAPVTQGAYLTLEMIRLCALAHERLPAELQNKLYGKKTGEGNGKSLLYAAAHLLMHDTNNTDVVVPISTNQAAVIVPDAIISIGGKQEGDFYDTRFALRSAAGEAYQLPTVQFITKHKVPPYMRAENGDIAMSKVCQQRGIDPAQVKTMDPLAKNDLSYLHTVSKRRGDIDGFIREFSERRAA